MAMTMTEILNPVRPDTDEPAFTGLEQWIVGEPATEEDNTDQPLRYETGTIGGTIRFITQIEAFDVSGIRLTREGIAELDKWIGEHQEYFPEPNRDIVANAVPSYAPGYCTPSREGILTGARPGRSWHDEVGQMPYRAFRELQGAVNTWAAEFTGTSLDGGGIDE